MQYVQVFDDFEFDVKMGAASEEMQAKYGLTLDELQAALDFHSQGNTLELEKLLGEKRQQALKDLPPPEAPSIVIEEEPERPDFGYRVTPLHTFIFVKPVPREHKSRLITPKAYESTSDIGFVHAIGPDVKQVEKGMLVMFDRYAEVGNRFEIVDDEGDVVGMIQMRLDNITAILERVKLDGIE